MQQITLGRGPARQPLVDAQRHGSMPGGYTRRLREALSVRVSHRFTAGSARFDEDNLVSHAGLVPLLGLAEQTRLPAILAEAVSITTSRIKSGAANPAPKLLGVIAGMCAGADSIDDLEVLRAGGMPILFDRVGFQNSAMALTSGD
jgi:hypothetical protein